MTLPATTHAEFPRLLADTPRLVVKFTADWCGPCRVFAPTVEAAARQHPDIAFVEVNIDQEPALAAQWRVRSIPFLLGLRDGKPAFQVLGAVSGLELERHLEKL